MLDRFLGGYVTASPTLPTQSSAQGVWELEQQASAQVQNAWPLPPNVIQRSLRFNSADSTYLDRTPATASNRKTWTWSGWVKLSGSFGDSFFFAGSVSSPPYVLFGITSNGALFCDYFSSAGVIGWRRTSTSLYRDSSAWYHFMLAVDTTQAVADDRLRFYVNGTQITSFSSSTNPSQNIDAAVNNTVIHNIGRYVTGDYVDGYMAEVNFVDGQALTPSSFGETDAQTGVWVPKRYTGTYGTNGFRLPFTNNSSTTALGFDASGNGNNWTPNNFSVTAGTGNDSLLDVPSLYGTDTGLGGEVRGNYCTLNPLDNGGITLSNGNLDATRSTATTAATRCTFAVSSGKWYWEVTPTALGALTVGIGTQSASLSGIVGGDAFGYGWYNDSGGTSSKYNNNVSSSYGIALSAGVTCGVALDLDAGTITFYRNGVSQGVAYSGITAGTYFPMISQWGGTTSTANLNFGQRPFAYTAPTGFKALCTTNFVAPAIGQTSTNQADNYFNTVLYNGTGATQSITGVGFQPDFLWIKGRSVDNHNLHNSIVGAATWLSSDTTGAEQTNSAVLTSFDADGFTVGSNPSSNASGVSFVAWCWNAGGNSVTNNAGSNSATIASTYRANKAAGFSVVSYAGSQASDFTMAHGLAAAPSLVITKSRNAVGEWGVYYTNEGVNTNWILLNSTAAKGTNNGPLSGGAYLIANAQTLQIAASAYANSASQMIAYCWAAIPGFSAFGSYTGNGSADGPFVYLGFRPAFLLLKNISQTYGWQIYDFKRNPTNRVNLGLYPNTANAEGTEPGTGPIDFLSNGFKIRDATWDEINANTRTYIYAAFAEYPFRLSLAR